MLMEKTKPGCAACRRTPALFPFTMAFQPVVDIEAGRIDAHEALVRGPEGEGAATILAQLTDANRYAFDQACRVKAIALAAQLGMDCQLNINFLPNAVYEPRACIQVTLRAAREHGFRLDRLTFELTEGEEVSDARHTRAIIEEYRRHGFRIALDDFGTGYSGLARLAELRPDIVKLDRALVQDCDRDPMRLAIVASMVGLGRAIGVKIVAEGVERPGEMTALRDAGVRFMQGYLFARPVLEGLAPWPRVLAPA